MSTLRCGTFEEFGQRIQRATAGRRLAVNATFEVTRRCNLNCVHCYNNLPATHPERDSELTADEHRRILGEAAEMGCFWLLYTGGEVFLRRDFLDIYTHAKRLGFLVTLFTNGTCVSKEDVACLADYPPLGIEITLYGASEATYERVTRVKGSFSRCMRTIDLVLDGGLPLVLKTVVLTINRHEFQDIRRLVERLGLRFRFDAMLNARADGSRRPLRFRLAPEEVVALDLEDERRGKEWKQVLEAQRATGQPPGPSKTVYSCGAGICGFCVDPAGKLLMCPIARNESLDLRQAGLPHGWERFLLQVRSRPTTKETKCTRCDLTSLCQMCPPNGQLERGDPQQANPFHCEVGHLRAMVFGLPIAAHGNCEFCPGGSRFYQTESKAEALLTSSRRFGQRPAEPRHSNTASARTAS